MPKILHVKIKSKNTNFQMIQSLIEMKKSKIGKWKSHNSTHLLKNEVNSKKNKINVVSQKQKKHNGLIG